MHAYEQKQKEVQKAVKRRTSYPLHNRSGDNYREASIVVCLHMTIAGTRLSK